MTLTWAQQYSAILSVIGSFSIAVGTFSAALITANRYLRLYQTHVSMEFFRRYADISQRMPDQLRLAKVRRDVTCEVREDDWARIDRAMIDYINLCSEEYALRKEKRIPDEIWKIWCNGIRENFETPIWREAWTRVQIEYRSYEDFCNFMSNIMKTAAATSAAMEKR